MENMRHINDTELEKVTGGEEETVFMYSFRVGDYVRFAPKKIDIRLQIVYDVDTNNRSFSIMCNRFGAGVSEYDSKHIKVSAGELYEAYLQYGGSLRAMK